MSGDWLAKMSNMEVNQHLLFFQNALCKRHYNISGVIDIDKDAFGYEDDGVFHFCDSIASELDRKELGIQEDVVLLYDSDNCVIHIAKDRETFETPCVYLILDKNNNVLYSKKNYFSSTCEFLRINTDSVILLEDENLSELCHKDSEALYIKKISKPEITEKQKAVIILNGIVQRDCKFLFKYCEYYFFLIDGSTKIYHARKGFVHEGELWLLWIDSKGNPFLIEKYVSNKENIIDGNVTVSTLEGKSLGNFHVCHSSKGEHMAYRSEDYACSTSFLVLKLFGNWIVLKKHSHDNFTATVKPIERDNFGKLKIINDFFLLDDMRGWAYLYDLSGNFIEHYPATTPSGHYSIFPKQVGAITYYGVFRLADFKIVIQPIYKKIEYLTYKGDLLRIFMQCADGEVEGVVSPEHGQVVPFGCNYYFSTYNNTHYYNAFRITSDTYLIYEMGEYKGLVFQGKNILGAEFDEISGFDYSADLGEYQEDEKYINNGTTAQWAPNCVVLKKNNLYGLFIDEKKILLPAYETMDYVLTNNTTHYFLAKNEDSFYMINNIDEVLFSVPSDHCFIAFNEESKLFAFKSIGTNKYIFYDYLGKVLAFTNGNNKIIRVESPLRPEYFSIEREQFLYRRRNTEDSDFIDYGYKQDELNDMYRDAFESSPEYESNID